MNTGLIGLPDRGHQSYCWQPMLLLPFELLFQGFLFSVRDAAYFRSIPGEFVPANVASTLISYIVLIVTLMVENPNPSFRGYATRGRR
jgi:hypothetical protein